MSSSRISMKKGASEFTLIRQTKASLMLIAKQMEAQVNFLFSFAMKFSEETSFFDELLISMFVDPFLEFDWQLPFLLVLGTFTKSSSYPMFCCSDFEGKNPETPFQKIKPQEWIQSVLNEKFKYKDFGKSLEDGILLCKLALAIEPGSIKKINSRWANQSLLFFQANC